MPVVVVMPVAFVMVRVAQQRDLLQQEEAQQPGQQRGEQRTRVGAGFEGLGQECSSAVASRTPTEKLTMRSTTRDATVRDNSAAPKMLPTPEMVAASRM